MPCVLQDRLQRGQRLPQVVQPHRVVRPERRVVDGAEHQRLGAAILGVGGERPRLVGPQRIPVVEALQRVDGDDPKPVALGRRGDIGRRRAVGDGEARKVVADLDRADAEPRSHREERLEARPRRHHMVQRKAQRSAHPVGFLPKFPRR